MKKNLIWLLTIVMALTFGALLYFQIIYLEKMVDMRRSQFSEGVSRSLSITASLLERQETIHYLAEDMSAVSGEKIREEEFAMPRRGGKMGFPSPTQDVSTHFRKIQEVIRSQYLYQRGMINEVIISIINEAPERPIAERADSVFVRQLLTEVFESNGVSIPFTFAVAENPSSIQYASKGFNREEMEDAYSITLFPNVDNRYQLYVEFPTLNNYIFSPVRFIIPTLAFTLMLLVIFLFTIILAFRQKRLTEMKTDFINNMTHELKTPVSTISLAGQMLSDPSMRKSPAMLNQLSEVITDESKRLRFQIEKVLQMSVLDNSDSALNMTEMDVNNIVASVVNTFKLKVEKFGGTLEMDLSATDAEIKADEMQFTNVIFNLLDNAVKYRDENKTLRLRVSTSNPADGKIMITIGDNGIGIKKEYLKKVFEKFYRVPTGNLHDVKGFGLGLTYVRKMVTLFSGTIHVESELGKGTRFHIELPTVG